MEKLLEEETRRVVLHTAPNRTSSEVQDEDQIVQYGSLIDDLEYGLSTFCNFRPISDCQQISEGHLPKLETEKSYQITC